MGEVKSTLELVMERTKKFSISEKEKEEIKQKEMIQKATSLFHRYLEGYVSLNEILKEIERMGERGATMVKAFLLSQWINALSLEADEERILKGIESLKQQNIDEIKQKLHQLLSQYQGEKEKARKKVKIQLAEVLGREGIYGSAVEPKLEGSALWKRENEKMDHFYRIKLEEIKERLRSLNQH
jgi:hypothetical protein